MDHKQKAATSRMLEMHNFLNEQNSKNALAKALLLNPSAPRVIPLARKRFAR